jgi:hypothetical protein
MSKGICAGLTHDGEDNSTPGLTWDAKKVIRRDGGTADLGYPRIVKRGEGSLLAVYDFNDGDREERYIAASVVTPAKIKKEPRTALLHCSRSSKPCRRETFAARSGNKAGHPWFGAAGSCQHDMGG